MQQKLFLGAKSSSVPFRSMLIEDFLSTGVLTAISFFLGECKWNSNFYVVTGSETLMHESKLQVSQLISSSIIKGHTNTEISPSWVCFIDLLFIVEYQIWAKSDGEMMNHLERKLLSPYCALKSIINIHPPDWWTSGENNTSSEKCILVSQWNNSICN